MYRRLFKGWLDFFLALVLLIITTPILLLSLIAITVELRQHPFFFQKRPGKDESVFTIIKLKTMNDSVNENGILLPDAERLTKTGKWIRKTSLDELPQLVNVLIGDMSFVGPRPLLIRYLPYYTEMERKRHSVRPGITGLAQISGRNLLDWDSRLNKDVQYVNNMSFLTDLRILYKTIEKVLLRKDVVVLPDTQLIDLDEHRKQ